MEDLLKMESTQLKMDQLDRSKDAGDKLSTNKFLLQSTITRLAEGSDNRSSILHKGRFLSGAGVSASKQWLEAKKHVDVKGGPAIGCYDMNSLGLAGIVTSKGWVEIHNPASTKISVKMFNVNGCRSDDKEWSSISEFKTALRAMRLAGRLAMPWNLSLEAVEGFFHTSDFCHSDTANTPKRASLLTQFTDYILHLNAERWQDAELIMTVADIRATWAVFFNARAGSSQAERKEERPFKKSFQNAPERRFERKLHPDG
jgi:hypothetical protein